MHAAHRNVLDSLRRCCEAVWNFKGKRDNGWRDFCREHIERGDAGAVGVGPLVYQIALEAGLTAAQTRRYLSWLESAGHAMRQPVHQRGTAHRWWAVGMSQALTTKPAKEQGQ